MQWRAALLQLVNWGGFGGLTTVPLRGDATMISGGFGVGKSTILDAYTALMMPSDTKFNGASNDAVAGRARGVGQRNLLSYLRGAVDVIDDPRTGRPVEKLLRGKGVDTWGAVAMTFVNDQGGRFTALRTYYVPRRATRSGDVQMQLATHEGALSLETLEVAVPERFHANTLKKLFPGIRVHRTYAEYSAVLHARLGIGANGDGAKALRLLARIQAGNQVRSVDELYKEMVLERPATYAAADRAIEHFDDLERPMPRCAPRSRSSSCSSPSPRCTTARSPRPAAGRARLLRRDRCPATPRCACGCCARTCGCSRQRWPPTATRVRRPATSSPPRPRPEVARQKDLEDAKEAHRAAGGSTLQSLGSRSSRSRWSARTGSDAAAVLQERLLPLIDATDSQAPSVDGALAPGFASSRGSRTDARQRLSRAAGRPRPAQAERDAALRAGYPMQQRQAELRSERASLEGRAGRVPAHLHELRSEVAAASGLGVEELPFVAELIDVAPEEARWRTAIETVLGGTARVMLVPLDRLEDFSAAIDGLQLRGRLTFEGAELDLARPGTRPIPSASPASSPSRTRRSPAGCRPTSRSRRATPSVSRPRRGSRVRVSGSPSPARRASGRRGAHGRSGQPQHHRLLQRGRPRRDRRRAGLARRLTSTASTRQVQRARPAGAGARAARTAYDAVAAARFDDLDVAGSDGRIAELERRRAEILASDDQLQVLQQQIEQLAAELETARKTRFRPGAAAAELNNAHGELVDSEDLVKDRLEAMQRTGTVALSEEQDAALVAEFAAAAAPADPEDLDRFNENSQRLGERLRAAVADARGRDQAGRARTSPAIFRLYKFQWDSPNLGVTVDSYADYARILDEIRGKGLAQRRSEWRRRLTEWSGQDLVPLVGAMAASIEDIEDRLEPINAILRRLKFGAVGRPAPDPAASPRAGPCAGLHEGPAGSLRRRDLPAGGGGPGAALRRAEPLHDPAPQSPATSASVTNDRDRLLDVRRHVEISAERYDHLTGELRATYRTLGEKSGGESQELVAFIVGSALRFRLGDEMRSRPRFAPVFLDEGFVKADSEFAGRAVQAWRGLGFQLIIGVPLDKVTGLEPHMDELLAITKNSATHQSWITPITDAAEQTPDRR